MPLRAAPGRTVALPEATWDGFPMASAAVSSGLDFAALAWVELSLPPVMAKERGEERSL